jgi:hypothetical protein
VSLRHVFLAVVISLCPAALGAGCSTSTAGPMPGQTNPGEACTHATDCGCWQCNCAGVSGAPGAAQLCVSGACPTGEAACTPICAQVGADLASAVSVDACDGRP